MGCDDTAVRELYELAIEPRKRRSGVAGMLRVTGYDNRSLSLNASATSVRTGFAAELNGMTDMSQT
jgi:hypothetical protein